MAAKAMAGCGRFEELTFETAVPTGRIGGQLGLEMEK